MYCLAPTITNRNRPEDIGPYVLFLDGNCRSSTAHIGENLMVGDSCNSIRKNLSGCGGIFQSSFKLGSMEIGKVGPKSMGSKRWNRDHPDGERLAIAVCTGVAHSRSMQKQVKMVPCLGGTDGVATALL